MSQSRASYPDHSEREEKEVDEGEKLKQGVEEMKKAVEEEKKGEVEGRRLERMDEEKKQKDGRREEVEFEEKQHFRPLYCRAHRKYLSTRTLDVFELPWELSKDGDYVIIKRWINEQWQDELFNHTANLRRNEAQTKATAIEPKKPSNELVLVREKGSAVENDENCSHSSEAPSVHDDGIPGPERLEKGSQRGDGAPSRKVSHSTINSAHSELRSNKYPRAFSGKKTFSSADESTDTETSGDSDELMRNMHEWNKYSRRRDTNKRAFRLEALVDSLHDAFQHPKIDDLCSFLEEEQMKSQIRDIKRRERKLGPNVSVANDKELYNDLNKVAKPFIEILAMRMGADEAEMGGNALFRPQKGQENSTAAPVLPSNSPSFAILSEQKVSKHHVYPIDGPEPVFELHPTEVARARTLGIVRILYRLRRWFAFRTLGRDADINIDSQPTPPLDNDAKRCLIDGATQRPSNRIRNYAIELEVKERGEDMSSRLFNLKMCERKRTGTRALCCTYDEASQHFSEGIVNETCMRQYLTKAEQLKEWFGLRCIYVEDDPNSFQEVMQRYNLLARHFGYDFSKWALGINTMDSQAGKHTFLLPPFSNFRKTFRHSAFGLDYLSPSNTTEGQTKPPKHRLIAERLLGTSDIEETTFIHRRCSIYLRQRIRDSSDDNLDDSSNDNPKTTSESNMLMDSTIIAADFGSEPSTNASLFPTPRKFQKMNFSMARLNGDDADAINSVLYRIEGNLVESWMTFIDAKMKVVRGLQELLLQEPASADIEPLLWDLSQEVTKALSLLNTHYSLLSTLMSQHSFYPPDRMRPLQHLLELQVKRPIEAMIDLLYKSISIRDARRSLLLNTSLWRLSWITFIFLPLTWLCGFFGMNVTPFNSDPSVGWYFVAAAPLMCLVFLAWLATKKLIGPGFDERQSASKMKAKLS